jgi:hypothetical protein
MRHWMNIVIVATITLAACNKSLTPEETQGIHETVAAQSYIFRAQSVSPLSGSNIQLSPGYDLQVTPNAVIATLPYYGRAYTAPVDPSAGGIRFTSKRFKYTATQNSKGEMDIMIIPEDVPEVKQLNLHISSRGGATLNVTSRDRQAITFYGEVIKTKIATAE